MRAWSRCTRKRSRLPLCSSATPFYIRDRSLDADAAADENAARPSLLAAADAAKHLNFYAPTSNRTHARLLTNGVLGIIFTALFLVLRVYMKQYQLRLVSREARARSAAGRRPPPPLSPTRVSAHKRIHTHTPQNPTAAPSLCDDQAAAHAHARIQGAFVSARRSFSLAFSTRPPPV